MCGECTIKKCKPNGVWFAPNDYGVRESTSVRKNRKPSIHAATLEQTIERKEKKKKLSPRP